MVVSIIMNNIISSNFIFINLQQVSVIHVLNIKLFLWVDHIFIAID